MTADILAGLGVEVAIERLDAAPESGALVLRRQALDDEPRDGVSQ